MPKDICFSSKDIEQSRNGLLACDALNPLELVSVKALVAYTANEQKTSETLIEVIVSDHFRVNNIRNIQRHNYDAAIFFLVDLNLKRFVN